MLNTSLSLACRVPHSTHFGPFMFWSYPTFVPHIAIVVPLVPYVLELHNFFIISYLLNLQVQNTVDRMWYGENMIN